MKPGPVPLSTEIGERLWVLVVAGIFGVAIGAAVDRLASRGWPSGWRRWVLPALLVVAFPFTTPVVGIAAVILVVWVSIRREFAPSGTVPLIAGLAIRSGWATVAVLGLVALARDVQALT